MEAARILASDAEFAAKLKAARARLIPYQIGKYGQLQEWSKDFEEKTPGQRHMSHMYPLFPGSEFTPRKNPAAWQSGAGFAGAAAGRGRRVYGMEPRVGHQFLGAAAGWREGV